MRPQGRDRWHYTYVWSAVTAYLEHEGISPVKACLQSEAISLDGRLSSLCAWI